MASSTSEVVPRWGETEERREKSLVIAGEGEFEARTQLQPTCSLSLNLTEFGMKKAHGSEVS
jgi:hypothetical protein